MRARCERPRDRTAEQRDELAPLQVIELHSVPSQGRIAAYRIRNDQAGGVPLCVNYLTLRNRHRWQPRTRGAIDSARWNMQMQHIRYFLALCEERSFTRAAKRCGVSQPSLTNAIMVLEQEPWRRAFSTQAPRRAHRARPRRPSLFRP